MAKLFSLANSTKLILPNEDDPITISSGEITADGVSFAVAAESSTSDDLDTINGGVDGEIIIIRADTGDTITVTSNDNINTDVELSGEARLMLQYDGSSWNPINESSSGGGVSTTGPTTYSCTFGGTSSNPTGTIFVLSNYYKIGSQVTFSIDASIVSIVTPGSGNLELDLPEAAANSAFVFDCHIYAGSINLNGSARNVSAVIKSSDLTKIEIEQTIDSGTAVNVAVTDFGAGDGIKISGTYFV